MWIILIGIFAGLVYEAFRQHRELNEFVNKHSKEQKAGIDNPALPIKSGTVL